MFFQHIYDKTLAHASYLIGCQQTKEAMVIDPQRDVDVYINLAKQNNLRITHIAETHIHADFLSGARELSVLTGADLYLSDEGGPDWQYEFQHIGLLDGQVIRLGNLSFEVWHTPGHTPESISFLLTDHPASDEPVMIFTGDFVFVGDIGRPDLLETAAGMAGTKELGARQMYASLERFKQLPAFIQVWPAHGAGSACGKSLGAVPSSTVGYEMHRNWALQPQPENRFVDELLADQPEAPRYFALMKKWNKQPRPLLTQVPEIPLLNRDEFLDAYHNKFQIIDTRHKSEYAAGHLPGTINIQNNNALPNWAGWMMDYSQPIILVAQSGEVDNIVRKLMRVGLDQVAGYIESVDEFGDMLATVDNISFEILQDKVKAGDTQVIDIRAATEYNAGHIPGADHVFLGTLAQNLDKIRKDIPVVIHCQAGDRSSIGYSLLEKYGIKTMNYPGGMAEWRKLGGKVVS